MGQVPHAVTALISNRNLDKSLFSKHHCLVFDCTPFMAGPWYHHSGGGREVGVTRFFAPVSVGCAPKMSLETPHFLNKGFVGEARGILGWIFAFCFVFWHPKEPPGFPSSPCPATAPGAEVPVLQLGDKALRQGGKATFCINWGHHCCHQGSHREGTPQHGCHRCHLLCPRCNEPFPPSLKMPLKSPPFPPNGGFSPSIRTPRAPCPPRGGGWGCVPQVWGQD